MSPKLRAMIFVVTVGATAGGVVYELSTPQPAARSMGDLKDAGILLGQPVVTEGSEKTTPQTRRRVKKMQPDALRPKQVYARIARMARCFGDKYLDGGFGNCVRVDGGSLAPFIEEVQEWRFTTAEPTEDGGSRTWLRTDDETVLRNDGGLYATLDHRNDGGVFDRVVNDPRIPQLITPSLRQNLAGIDLDAGISDDDGGDSDDVDDSLQFRLDSLVVYHCNQFDDLVDAGLRVNPFANRFCANLNRLAAQPLPNMIPDCRQSDGGWDDDIDQPGHEGAPNCKFSGPFGLADGGPRWAGCNSYPREFASGNQCLPVESSVVSGDSLTEEWP